MEKALFVPAGSTGTQSADPAVASTAGASNRKAEAKAFETLPRDQALQQYPTLKTAYEVQDAMELTVRSVLRAEERTAAQFAELTRTAIARDLSAGRSVELKPAVEVVMRDLREDVTRAVDAERQIELNIAAATPGPQKGASSGTVAKVQADLER